MAAEYHSGTQPFAKIEAELDRKLAKFRQYNPAADELVPASEWLDNFPNIPREPVSPILSGLWPRGEWAYLSGRVGKGKSWLGFTIVDAIKGGRKFLSFDTHGANMRMGIITPELGPEEVEARFRKLVGGTLHPGLALFDKQNLPAGLDLGTEQTRRAVLRWIDDLGLELIVVDLLTACYHGQLWGDPNIPLLRFLFDLHRFTWTGCGATPSPREREQQETQEAAQAAAWETRDSPAAAVLHEPQRTAGKSAARHHEGERMDRRPLSKFYLEIDTATGRWIAAEDTESTGARGHAHGAPQSPEEKRDK